MKKTNWSWSDWLTPSSSSSDSADKSSCHETKDNIKTPLITKKKNFEDQTRHLKTNKILRWEDASEVWGQAVKVFTLLLSFVNYIIMNQKFVFFLVKDIVKDWLPVTGTSKTTMPVNLKAKSRVQWSRKAGFFLNMSDERKNRFARAINEVFWVKRF